MKLWQNKYRTPVTHTRPGVWGKMEMSSGLWSAASMLVCEHKVLSWGRVQWNLYKTHKHLSLLSTVEVLCWDENSKRRKQLLPSRSSQFSKATRVNVFSAGIQSGVLRVLCTQPDWTRGGSGRGRQAWNTVLEGEDWRARLKGTEGH